MPSTNYSKILTLFPTQVFWSVILGLANAVIWVFALLLVAQVLNAGNWVWIIVIADIVMASLSIVLTIYNFYTRNQKYTEGKTPSSEYSNGLAQITTNALGYIGLTIVGLILVIGSSPTDFDPANVANFVSIMIFYGLNAVTPFVAIVVGFFGFAAHTNFQKQVASFFNVRNDLDVIKGRMGI